MYIISCNPGTSPTRGLGYTCATREGWKGPSSVKQRSSNSNPGMPDKNPAPAPVCKVRSRCSGTAPGLGVGVLPGRLGHRHRPKGQIPLGFPQRQPHHPQTDLKKPNSHIRDPIGLRDGLSQMCLFVLFRKRSRLRREEISIGPNRRLYWGPL